MGTQLALAVERLPFLTRAQALEEGERNPKFWPYLGSLMVSPDPAAAVDNELKRAAIDALAPGRYPEAGKNWPMFRSKIRDVRDRISNHLRGGGALEGLFSLSEIPGIVTSYDSLSTPAATPAASSGGTDIWGTIGKVLATVGTAAASIYGTKIQTDAAKSIAGTQAGVLTAQQQAQQQAAAAQVAQQQANLLAAQKQAGASGSSGSVILYVLLGILGLGGLMFLMSRMK